MKFVQMGLLATVLAFGLVVVIGFTNANWYAQLRYSKVMITEIVEGPYSINNIDLYSNYSGNNIVSLNLSFLVLTCKAILWQKSNLSNHKESCSVFVMNLRHCLKLRLTFFFCYLQAAIRFFSWAMSRSHCSFVWDSQLKELHFTAPSLKQHCTQLQDKIWECVLALTSIDVSVRLYPQLFNFTFTSNSLKFVSIVVIWLNG